MNDLLTGLGLPSLSRTFCYCSRQTICCSIPALCECGHDSSLLCLLLSPLRWLLYNFGLGYSYDCESTVERRRVRCYDCVYHFLYGCSVPYTESCLSVFYKMFIYYPQLTKPFCTPSGFSKCIEQPPLSSSAVFSSWTYWHFPDFPARSPWNFPLPPFGVRSVVSSLGLLGHVGGTHHPRASWKKWMPEALKGHGSCQTLKYEAG